jgi:hypothetical protein
MGDTSAHAQARYVELLRQRTPRERLAISVSLSRAVRELVVSALRAQSPDAGEEEIRARLAVRLFGRAVAERIVRAVPDDAR